jgi:hypothetical protein
MAEDNGTLLPLNLTSSFTQRNQTLGGFKVDVSVNDFHSYYFQSVWCGQKCTMYHCKKMTVSS